VQAGTYRESELKFPHNGTPEAPIILRGEGKVQILGSERIAHWHALDDTAVPNFPTAAKKQIFWADLSAWQLQTAPRFVLQRVNPIGAWQRRGKSANFGGQRKAAVRPQIVRRNRKRLATKQPAL
jgi:hypothetical protein